MRKARILFYDLETAPNEAYVWGKYDQNVLKFKKERYILSVAYRWQHEKKVHCFSRRTLSNLQLLRRLRQLVNSADIAVAHNGIEFDNKVSNAQFAIAKVPRPQPYRSIDTLKVCKKNFNLNSYSLADVSQLFGLGTKKKTLGIDTWLGCMAGELCHWKTLESYNKRDVVLEERLYKYLLPWIDNHPNVAVIEGRQGCPKGCKAPLRSMGLRSNGTVGLYRRYLCTGCWGWARQRLSEKGAIKPRIVNVGG